MDFSNTDLLDLTVHIHDPEPFYQWMRDESPVYWDEKNELWALARYEDVVFASRNTDIFCNRYGTVPGIDLDIWPDEAMINRDGRDHTVQRALVRKGFTRRSISDLENRIRQLTTILIDRVAPTGHCDVVRDLARPLPMLIMADMFGYPDEMAMKVLDWTDEYVMGGCGPEHVTEAVEENFGNFVEFHEELLEERKANPGEDLLSLWLSAEIDGEKLSEDKILYEHNLLLVGGSESTRHAISGAFMQLMEQTDVRDHLRDNPDSMKNAVEEIMRWTTPFIRMARTLLKPHEMHGRMLNEGDQVLLLYPAANRDPRVFADPQRFDISRRFSKPAVSFGFGRHYCLGAALARLEVSVMLEEVLRRMPDMRLAGDPVWKPSCFLRGLSSLPVTFTPEH